MNSKRQPKRRGHGESTIGRCADGTFVARVSLGFDPKGKRIRKLLYAETAERLRLKIAQEQQRFANRPDHHDDARHVTLEAFLKEWLQEEVLANNRPATYKLREVACRKHIIPSLGPIKLADLESANVRGLFQHLRSKKIGPRMQQVVHATLSCALGVAVRDELLEKNVVSIVERPKAQKREKYILDEHEAKRLLEAAKGDPYETLYILALTTGMRQGELFALEWGDVELQQAVLRVRSTLAEDADGHLVRSDTKTASSRRNIDLLEIAVVALREHRVRSQGLEGYVFRDSTGGPIRKSNFLRRHFHPLLEKANLPRITFHTLRLWRTRSCSRTGPTFAFWRIVSATPPRGRRWITTAMFSPAHKKKPPEKWTKFSGPDPLHSGHEPEKFARIGHDWPRRAVSQIHFEKQKTPGKPYATDA